MKRLPTGHKFDLRLYKLEIDVSYCNIGKYEFILGKSGERWTRIRNLFWPITDHECPEGE